MEKQDLKSMSYEKMVSFVQELGEPKFRADQIFEWIHSKNAYSFDEITNISKKLRAGLSENAYIASIEPVEKLVSGKDGTSKYLFRLEDGEYIESVRMEYKHGCSVCISSQVGCACGCRFCASTIGGFVRNLTAAEMLEQVYKIGILNEKKVDNVVVMGSGEPMYNFDNLILFLEILNDKKGKNLSLRNVTVSTCGIVPQINRLAQLKLPITLAVSLHAPNDEIRTKIMPVALKYPIDSLIESCRDYFEKTGRRITFEYALMEGVNDSRECAYELARLLKGINCHVNIINVHAVEGTVYKKSLKGVEFQKFLEKNKINATIRRELGDDIEGACGQLRRRYI